MKTDFLSVTLELLKGFGVSLEIFVLTLVFAIPLGLLVCFGSISKFKPLQYLTRAFVWIIRGTPLMLQIMVIFFVPGLVFEMPFKSRMLAVLIAFVINYACYFSEIYRGGINSIPKGQYEAGALLGMTKTQTFMRIVLPQVYKRILPPMGNEIITLVKDTSLARVVAVVEVLMVAERYTARGIVWPLFYTGVFYLVMCGILTILFSKLEKRNDRWQ